MKTVEKRKRLVISRKRSWLRWLGMVAGMVLVACGGGTSSESTSQGASENTTMAADPMKNKGIGPVQTVTLGPIEPALAQKGEELFNLKCTACHKMDSKVVGPPLKGITTRRTPEWIMNMILNPEQMTREDPIAKALLAEYISPMANQSLSQEEARAILEYFRQYDSQNP